MTDRAVLSLWAGVGRWVRLALALALLSSPAAAGTPEAWRREFPKTDFSKTVISLGDIKSDGPTRDTIPPILNPRFRPAAKVRNIGPLEPVISVEIKGERRAYPLRILLWHEIVNDVISQVPVLVTYCPLCNSGVVFERRIAGKPVVFGNTGRIRHFDMVMYDGETESWWQQTTGRAIIGRLAGLKLNALPHRLESLASFRARGPGRVLVPEHPHARPYGQTPFAGTEGANPPKSRFPYPLPPGIKPFDRVVVIGDRAWPWSLLKLRKKIVSGDLVITWRPGQNSIHDTPVIAKGRDVGTVIVQRKSKSGLVDHPYDALFAFAFSAFVPKGRFILK